MLHPNFVVNPPQPFGCGVDHGADFILATYDLGFLEHGQFFYRNLGVHQRKVADRIDSICQRWLGIRYAIKEPSFLQELRELAHVPKILLVLNCFRSLKLGVNSIDERRSRWFNNFASFTDIDVALASFARKVDTFGNAGELVTGHDGVATKARVRRRRGRFQHCDSLDDRG